MVPEELADRVSINVRVGDPVACLDPEQHEVARGLVAYDAETGGGATQSPQIKSSIPTFDVPLLSDFFTWLADLDIFFIMHNQ